jgi:hypothetical protein
MKKTVFEAPELEVLKCAVDVITTSNFDNYEDDIFPEL